jgi:hypothetical protein
VFSICPVKTIIGDMPKASKAAETKSRAKATGKKKK